MSEGSSNSVNSQVMLSCWSRLHDLHTLNKITTDQRNVLASQIEVRDGEVIHHLMVESSDKIIKLAGDLMYEKNLAKSIDGGRGNVVVIERSDDSDPALNDNIVIETHHSVLRFSVSRYNRNVLSSGVPSSDEHDSHPHSLTRQSSKSMEAPPVSRRAFNAAQYLQRMRSQSQMYTSDLAEETERDTTDTAVSTVSLDSLGSLSSGSLGRRSVDKPATSSPSKEKRITKHTSLLPTADTGMRSNSSFTSDFNSPSGSPAKSDVSSTATDSPNKSKRPPRPATLHKTPSARRLKAKKNMLHRLTSFEDDTHVTIPIEQDVEGFTSESPVYTAGGDDTTIIHETTSGKDSTSGNDTSSGKRTKSTDSERESKAEKKSTAGMFGLTRRLSELWGLSRASSQRNDGSVGSAGSGTGSVTNGDGTQDNDMVFSYDDSYSPWASLAAKEDWTRSGSGTSIELSYDEGLKISSESVVPVVDNTLQQKMEKAKRKPNLGITMGSFKKMFRKEVKRRRSSVAQEFAISNSQIDSLSKAANQSIEAEMVTVLDTTISTTSTTSISSTKKCNNTDTNSVENEVHIGDVDDGHGVGGKMSSCSRSSIEIESINNESRTQSALVVDMPENIRDSSKDAISTRSVSPCPPESKSVSRLMENRTVEDYNTEQDTEEGDVRAIRIPKRFLSYYVGGCGPSGLKDSPHKILPRRPSNNKKILPSHKIIQKEVSHLESNFQTRQLSVQRQNQVAAELKKHNDNNKLEDPSHVDAPPPAPSKSSPVPEVVQAPVVAKPVKNIRFSTVEMRFYGYTTGSGVPSDGGPSLGLHGDYNDDETLKIDLEVFEDFRGGILPEDEEVDEDEEWNDNWRLPREYFVDRGGHLPTKERIALLRAAGSRRCSVDLSIHLSKLTLSSRLKNARSRVPRLIIEGMDLDEVTDRMVKWEATQQLEPLLISWAQRWLQRRYPHRYSNK